MDARGRREVRLLFALLLLTFGLFSVCLLPVAALADETARPSLELLQWRDGALVSGDQIPVTVSFYSPGAPVERVDLLIDEVIDDHATLSPARNQGVVTLTWNLSAATEGLHLLTVRTKGSGGQTGERSVSVHFQRSGSSGGIAPPLRILAPQAGAELNGLAEVTAAPLQEISGTGKTYVSLLVDGQLIGLTNVPPIRFQWNTRRYPNAPHVLLLRSEDAAGILSLSDPIIVRVNNPTEVASVRGATPLASSQSRETTIASQGTPATAPPETKEPQAVGPDRPASLSLELTFQAVPEPLLSLPPLPQLPPSSPSGSEAMKTEPATLPSEPARTVEVSADLKPAVIALLPITPGLPELPIAEPLLTTPSQPIAQVLPVEVSLTLAAPQKASPAPATTVALAPKPLARAVALPWPVHKVQRGETMSALAQRYGLKVEHLRKMNGLSDPNHLTVGQMLLIPSRGLGQDLLSREAGTYAIVVEGRSLLAVRPVAESNGYVVNWKAIKKEIALSGKGSTVLLTVGQPKAKRGEKVIDLGSPVVVQAGRAFLPLPSLTRILGLSSQYNLVLLDDALTPAEVS